MNRTPWNIAAARMPVWGAHFFESAAKARSLWRAIEKVHGKGSGMIRRPLKLGYAWPTHWRVARRPMNASATR
jgi:hypothetical protein